jgi:hypothetical protein
MEAFEALDLVDGVGVCLLHIAAIHTQVGNFKESHKVGSAPNYSVFVVD